MLFALYMHPALCVFTSSRRQPETGNQKQVTSSQHHAHHLPQMSLLFCHLGAAITPWVSDYGFQKSADAGD